MKTAKIKASPRGHEIGLLGIAYCNPREIRGKKENRSVHQLESGHDWAPTHPTFGYPFLDVQQFVGYAHKLIDDGHPTLKTRSVEPIGMCSAHITDIKKVDGRNSPRCPLLKSIGK